MCNEDSAGQVITIAPDSDMAVLRVKDTELWKDVGPLKVNRKVPAGRHSPEGVLGCVRLLYNHVKSFRKYQKV